MRGAVSGARATVRPWPSLVGASASGWAALGSGINNRVQALGMSSSDLYVGGDFRTAGGIAVNYITKWNGDTWTTLGSGLNGSVEALAVSNTNLYVGGVFRDAGG